MTYIPDPTNPNSPTTADLAGNMAAEFQALKGYIQSLIATGTNFYNIAGFRNRLKNGGLRIAQRGQNYTVAAGTTSYTLDQWLVTSTGGATTITQQTGALAGYGANSSFMQLALGTGVTFVSVFSRIESGDCQDLISGQAVTVSGIFCTNGTGAVPSIQLSTPTVGNTFSVQTNAAVAQNAAVQSPLLFTIPTNWQYFSNTFILTTDCTAGLQVALNYNSPPVSGTIQLGQLQLEKSLYPTPFEQRPQAVDFAICQRYYQRNGGAFGQYASAAGQMWYTSLQFYPQMLNLPGGTCIFSFTPSGLTNLSSVAAVVPGNAGVTFAATATAAGATYYNYLYTISCEL